MDCCARSGDENNNIDDHRGRGEPPPSVRLRSGFTSLKERLSSLARHGAAEERPAAPRPQRREPTETARQFATLQELFSARHNLSYERSEPEYCVSKTKIPIMRLKKDDWNVKCWEDRLHPHRRRRSPRPADGQKNTTNKATTEGHRARAASEQPAERPRLKLQADVFNDRIADVALKLDKVREGAPQDALLYELASNRAPKRRAEPGREWTSLLKEELSTGAHNPRTIEARLAAIGRDERRAPGVKSPIGRYIGRIIDDADSDGDDDVRAASK